MTMCPATLSKQDIESCKRGKSLIGSYYRDVNLCFIFFSVNDRESFETLPAFLKIYWDYNSLSPFKENIFIIGNWIHGEKRQVTFEESEVWAEAWGYHYMEIELGNEESSRIFDAMFQGMSNVLYLQQRVNKS